MNLLSIQFILFFVVSLTLYYIIPKKYQWIILLLSSAYFYVSSMGQYSLYIVFTIFTIFFSSTRINRMNLDLARLDKKNHSNEIKEIKKNSKIILIITLIMNFSVLIFLKYISSVLSLDIFRWIENPISFIMPLGISFYTFQSTGYLIDVYNKRVEAEKNIFKLSLFISYFPQIIQGPISKFKTLSTELFSEHTFSHDNIVRGLQLVLWGIFKKIVIADRAGVLVKTVFDSSSLYDGIILFIACLFYAIQIYGDFSGGIDMIRGISQCFGIDLIDNFRRPYFAISVSDFWKRWHITLGSWMRDYVFYPLALSRPLGNIGRKSRKVFGNYIGKQIPVAISSFFVFVLVGIWHGSSLRFVAYGVYNGIFVLSEPLLKPFYERMKKLFGINNSEAITFKVFQVVRTIFIITVGRAFSRGSQLKVSLEIIKSIFTKWNPWVLLDDTILRIGLDGKDLFVLFISLIILFIVSLMQEKGYKIRDVLSNQPLIFRWLIIICFINFILIFGYYGSSVSSNDFIYQGF